jgi:amino acid transporter
MATITPQQRPSTVLTALAQSRLGRLGVTSSSLAAVAPLTVVAGGATLGYALLGTGAIPIAYVAIGLILAIFSAGYTAMARKITNAGALYTYVARGLGRIPGVGCAFVAVISYAFMGVGLAGGFGAVASEFLGDNLGWTTPWWVCALAGWAAVTVLGVRRIDLNGRVLGLLLAAEVTIAAGYALVQLAHPADGHLAVSALSPQHLLDGDAGAALVVAITGFVGFETTAVFTEESKDSRRTVPHATYLALLVSTVLYAGCSWAMSVATGPDRIVSAAQAEGSNLIFALVEPHVVGPLVLLGRLLFVTSLFAAMLSFHNTNARYLYALGREGVLSRRLARTSSKSLAPRTASFTQSGITLTVIGLYAVAGWDPMVNLFFWLTVAGGLGILALLTVTSIAILFHFAVPEHRHRRPAAGEFPIGEVPRPRRDVSLWSWPIAPLIATTLLTVTLVLTLRQFHLLLGVEPTSSWRWAFPIAFAVAALGGASWAALLRRTDPAVYRGIGLGASSVVTSAPNAGNERTGAR